MSEAMANPSDIFVLYPEADGTFAVVAVGDLNDRLAHDAPDEAAGETAIDTLTLELDDGDRKLIERIRRLNETGDAARYWHPEP